MTFIRRLGGPLAAVLLSGCALESAERMATEPSLKTAKPGGDFEVWLVDQSNSPGLAYGGTLYVYEGMDLMDESAGSAEPTARIDLAGAAAALCLASTGSNPVRPHMVSFNSTHTHAILAFVATGHVAILDAATRAPLACIDVGVQAHSAVAAPDDSYILIANLNGKLLQRVNANFATNTFSLDAAATLDLAACTTPNGAPCEDAALRPDNAPVCPAITPAGDLAFVTLRGGGMFVIDPRASPMVIRGEYDRGAVHPNGCGGIAGSEWMFVTSGGGTIAHPHEFDVYRFRLSAFSPLTSNLPNTPGPAVLMSDDASPRDAQGTGFARHQRYLWVADRGSNLAEVFDAGTGAHLNTVGLSGPAAGDPTPDLIDFSPSGNRLFASLRGPNPLTDDPQTAAGSTPGIGIYLVQAGGADGVFKAVVRVSNLDAGGIERADPHGIRVRRK